jgi:WD40 repeat protein
MTAQVWDVESKKELLVLRHSEKLGFAAFSPDGKKIITCSFGATARIYNAESGKELLVLKDDTKYQVLSDVFFSPDGQRIVTVGEKIVRIWDAQSGKELQELRREQKIKDAFFSPDGQKIATVCLWGPIHSWDAESGKELQKIGKSFSTGPEAIYQSYLAAFLPDGKSIMTIYGDDIRIWDVETGKEVRKVVLQGLYRERGQ